MLEIRIVCHHACLGTDRHRRGHDCEREVTFTGRTLAEATGKARDAGWYVYNAVLSTTRRSHDRCPEHGADDYPCDPHDVTTAYRKDRVGNATYAGLSELPVGVDDEDDDE